MFKGKKGIVLTFGIIMGLIVFILALPLLVKVYKLAFLTDFSGFKGVLTIILVVLLIKWLVD